MERIFIHSVSQSSWKKRHVVGDTGRHNDEVEAVGEYVGATSGHYRTPPAVEGSIEKYLPRIGDVEQNRRGLFHFGTTACPGWKEYLT